MTAVLADTGKGLLVCELQNAHPKWRILGDMLENNVVGLFNPTLPPILRFISPYYRIASVSEIAAFGNEGKGGNDV